MSKVFCGDVEIGWVHSADVYGQEKWFGKCHGFRSQAQNFDTKQGAEDALRKMYAAHLAKTERRSDAVRRLRDVCEALGISQGSVEDEAGADPVVRVLLSDLESLAKSMGKGNE